MPIRRSEMDLQHHQPQLRAKVIGGMIKQARQAAKRSPEECGRVINISAEEYQAMENGERPISLPELEALAYSLNVPLEYFWERDSLGEQIIEEKTLNQAEQLIKIRHRMIGALLRQARLEAGYTLEALAERAGIDPAKLEAYEYGTQSTPLPDLEVLTGLLHRSIREFQDQHGPVGVWNIQQKAIKDFLSLPLHLQLFVSKPVNRPYLELAIRLNDMSVEKLRTIAEGLLEITY
jgi:transcriptional regulator with XRE-family HTH domain